MIGTRVGIDIRDDMVVAVEVKGNLRQQVISGVAAVPLASATDLAAAIRNVSELVGATGGDCVSVIPAGRLSFRNLRMPFQSEKKIGQTIGYELETMLPSAVEGRVVDFVVATPGAQPDVLAAMAPREFLGEYLEQWQAADVEPAVLEVRDVPLARWLAQRSLAPDCGLLLDLRRSGGEMVLFRDGRVVLVREIFVAGEMDSDESGEETCGRFCRAVMNTVRAFNSEGDGPALPEAVFVTGPIAGTAGMMELLEAGTGLRVEQVDLAIGAPIALDATVAEQWDGLLMDGALALALRSRRGDGTGFNFRKEEFVVNRPLYRFKKEVVLVTAFAAMFASLLAVNSGIEYFYLQRQYQDLDHQITALFRETLPQVTRIVDPVQQLRVKIREIKRTPTGRNNAWADISVLDFLKEISDRVPASFAVRLTRLALDQEGARIKGETDNFNNVDMIKKDLEASSLFKDVTISSANLDRAGSKVLFELRIQ